MDIEKEIKVYLEFCEKNKGLNDKTIKAYKIDLKQFAEYAERVPHISVAPDNYEGVRVNFDKDHGDGWALLRMSLHEPILPVNAESGSEGGSKVILKEIYGFLKDYPCLDLTPLTEIIKD